MLTLATSAGEWISAYAFFGVAFAVAVAGVTGLGVWVLRGDARNRRKQIELARQREAAEEPTAQE